MAGGMKTFASTLLCAIWFELVVIYGASERDLGAITFYPVAYFETSLNAVM